jgi:putative peptide zinc metalloprotease protein
MAPAPATFSESWYRLANQRIWLRPGVHVRRQNYRGERWIVLENPFSNQFFRIRPAAYEFIARLGPERTAQQAWQECLDRFPDDAPGQESVIQLLSQLYHANLLQYENAADSAQLFERYKKRREREVRSRLLNLMFMRFPLLDPDRFLVRTLPFVGKFISAFGALIWLAVVGWGIKVAIDNFPSLRDETQSVLATNNLLLLYLGMVIIKTLHEFGHAYFCRKWGGEVHVMGVLLMIFTPMPYVDATSSWSFRSRWKRIMVSSAGMIVELFIAAIMVFVWANTGPGLLHNLAYNMIFIASVSTLVFNLNPLLRFDGYYILSDLVEIPNLQQRANRQLRHLCERYLFGVKKSQSPTDRRKEGFWLAVYGVASGIYRVIVFAGILLIVADHFFMIGIIMAAVCAISWVLVPTVKFVQYLASSTQLDRRRARAVAVSAAGLIAILVLLAVVKFPSHFRAPGVLLARERSQLVAETPGYLVRILAQTTQTVKAGQPLLEFSNPEVDLELASARAAVTELDARIRLAMRERTADVKPLTMRMDALTQRVQKLEADKAALIVKARHDGIWISPEIQDQVGRWLARGARLGLLVNPAQFEFAATVKQEDGDALFGRNISGAEIRLLGEAGRVVPITKWRIIPGEQQTLPSAALGWISGGEVPVNPDDPQKAAEPFFEVHADIGQTVPATILHGRSGKIRFDLEPEPLLPRWLRRLQQLLQKRYQL